MKRGRSGRRNVALRVLLFLFALPTSGRAAGNGEQEQSEAAGVDEVGKIRIGGFFDVLAGGTAVNGNEVRLNALEVDLELGYGDHVSASAALVWSGGDAKVAAAFVDYHLFDDRVPPRGRIFEEPGLHLQAGRFDLPFAADFRYFAAPDRPNITAPLTTERLQAGGFNADGLRVYGSVWRLDWAVYWTSSIFHDGGHAVGGRAGFFPGLDPYRFHGHTTGRWLELGVSSFADVAVGGKVRNIVSAADLRIAVGPLQIGGEAAFLDARIDTVTELGVDLGEQDAWSAQGWLVLQLDGLLERSLRLFGRYDTWSPEYRTVADADDAATLYPVANLRRATVGLGWIVNDSLQAKLELQDSLGTRTAEPGFETRLLLAQVVASL